MACFLVPTALAIVVSIIRRVAKSASEKIRLGLLEAMLWGGAVFLALEHMWHGEVVPYPPFLTAMKSPEEWATALHEMATNGVAMAVVVTATWGGILAIQRMLSLPKIHKAVMEKRAVATAPTPSK